MTHREAASPQGNVEEQAKALAEEFGEFAPTYADTRSEAAELRGADDAAERWREVRDKVEKAESE